MALKFLSPYVSQSKEEKQRFIHEAKAASALDHTNICTIYEISETEEDQMFIAMAFYGGETVRDKIERGPLKLDEAIDITHQIAEGLARAHESDIIHRDIKPANILITERREVKIVDFGLAKLSGRTQLTKEGSTIGTISYMSPEQTQGAAVDHRTDIWALGVVLYEMITGKQPFQADYEQAVLYSIMNEDPEPPTALRTGVPMELERIVLKALAKEPSGRYQHVDEMLVDLHSAKKNPNLATKNFPSVKPPINRRKVFLRAGLVAVGVVLSLLLIFVGLSFFPGSGKTINSIAVLPLENLSRDPEQEYFTDGMTDAIISDLGTVGALRVISRRSVMQYKGIKKPLPEIARELNVSHIVEGAVLRVDHKVRITTHLIDALKDQQLWSKKYERDLTDVLSLQSELARDIAEEIKVQLTPQEQARLLSTRLVNPEVQDAYLQGRFHLAKVTTEDTNKAIEYFEEAIEKDSTYAPAYAGLAQSFIWLGQLHWTIPHVEAMPKAREAAEKALENEETSAEAHTALGTVLWLYDWEWVEAEHHLKRAMALNPSYPDAHWIYGAYLSTIRERHEEAISKGVRALELDPRSLHIRAVRGEVFIFARQYERAIEECRRALDMDPEFGRARLVMRIAYEKLGKYEAAIADYQEEFIHSGGGSLDEKALAALESAYAVWGGKGYWQWRLDRLQQALAQGYVNPMQVAEAYAGLGEMDNTFEWLERAYEVRHGVLPFLKVLPWIDAMRSNPRFATLLKKVGLPE